MARAPFAWLLGRSRAQCLAYAGTSVVRRALTRHQKPAKVVRMATTANDILVRVRMTADSGLVEDEIVNDFSFQWIAGGASYDNGDFDALLDAVDQFYNAADTPTYDPVGAFISTHVDRGATHSMEFVNIATGGSPLYSNAWLGPTTPVGTTNFPNEVAAVLSFHGELTGVLEEVGTTRPRARRRGRVYIGPLRNPACVVSDPAPPLSDGFLHALRFGATSMYDAADAAGWRWCVWSRAGNTLYPVVGGWTDNAPDTQRRRGQVSSSRVTFTT